MTPQTRDVLDRALCLREEGAMQLVRELFPFDCTPDEAAALMPTINVHRLLQERDYDAAFAMLDDASSTTPYRHTLYARCLTAMQRFHDVYEFVDKTLRDTSDLTPAEEVSLLMSKGRAATQAHEYQSAMSASIAARERALLHGFDTTASRMLTEIATITCYTGDIVRAIAMYEQSLMELSEHAGFEAERLRIQLNLASCYLNVERNADALQTCEILLANDLVRMRDDVMAAICLNSALALKLLGRDGEAHAKYLLSMEVAERGKIDEMQIKACVGLADLFVRQHEYDRALQLATRALSIATEAEVDAWGLEARALIASIHMHSGRVDDAMKDMFACVDAALAGGDANMAISFASELCAWLVEREQYREAYFVQERLTSIRRDVYEKEIERTLEVSAIRSRLDQERDMIRLREEARNAVLHSVFPPAIAARLMSGEMPIADRLDNVALMFVDIVSFTRIATTIDPEDLLAMLERLFTGLDRICHAHGCERIKTIGDAYMAVSVNGATLQENTERIVRAALEMIDPGQGLAMPPERLRIGVHSGPVIAGVMGGARLSYDMWGDTVNVAARMEEHSAPGRITCSSDVKALLHDHPQFRFEQRDPLSIRGKGLMTTYWLEGTNT